MKCSFWTGKEVKNWICLQKSLFLKKNPKSWLAIIDPDISLKWEKSGCITESSSANCHSDYLLRLTQDNILFSLKQAAHWVQNPVIYVCKVPWGHVLLLAFTQHSSSWMENSKQWMGLTKEPWICISYHIDFTAVFVWDTPCALSLDLKHEISD